ncbi:uncharacterized protein LOC142323715 isoform X2 [Lycorma delicatula]|uniref:uncharacterized protein LOC142323715 isoform X2 n=1 Tax=Lycorma delicatula TaxID=130591 RepID=UPI003F50FFCF
MILIFLILTWFSSVNSIPEEIVPTAVSNVAMYILQNRTDSINVTEIVEPAETNTTFDVDDNYENEGKTTQNDNWDCAEDEIEKKQNLILMNGMMKIGEEEISKQSQNKIKETILVLGDAGAGKTTFVQFMAGDNTKLISKEIGLESGQFMIEDGLKIGTSATESLTLYPEQVVDNSGYSFTDTPGFSDTRSPAHEVVATYTMKKYLNNIENIKIVLLITYSSVVQTLYKDHFLNLLRNLNTFINDTDLYVNNIVLIATKVPNMYKVTSTGATLISDKTVIQNIKEYMSEVKRSLLNKILNSQDSKEERFALNAIKIINCLHETDENGNYKKINIFRQPAESGVISELESCQENKKSLQKTVFNINYTKISTDNIGYTLSHGAKNYLHCLLWYINEDISEMSSYIFQSIKNYYKTQIDSFDDIFELYTYTDNVYKKVKLIKNYLKESNDYKHYTTLIEEFIINENITFQNTEKNTTFEINEYISNVQQFTNIKPILSTIKWAEEIRVLLNYIKEELSWNNFLIELFKQFSKYEIHKLKPLHYNKENVNEANKSSLSTVLENSVMLFYKNLNPYFNILELSGDKKKDINNIVHITLYKNDITCDENGKLKITGFFTKFSLIINKTIIKEYCGDKTLKVIVILAIHTVFIDVNINDEDYSGIDIMIAAPRCEVIGKRIINVNGKAAGPQLFSKAKDGEKYGDGGDHGITGSPGENGGNILIITTHIINAGNLMIKADGGDGGPGQDGGDGKDGKDGIEGYEKYTLKNYPREDNDNIFWGKGFREFPLKYSSWNKIDFPQFPISTTGDIENLCYGDIKLYIQLGECGTPGGIGGNGGAGGIGGHGGKVAMVLGENDITEFSISNNNGKHGLSGRYGNGGLHGKTGKSVTCFKLFLNKVGHGYDSRNNFWQCTNLTDTVIQCPLKDIINNGITINFDKNGPKPKEPKVYNFYNDLQNYISSLKEYENNKFLKKYSKLLQNHINENTKFINNVWIFQADVPE